MKDFESVMNKNPKHFLRFKQSIDSFNLPKRFNFPFSYEPHELCILAAQELQDHLLTQKDWVHNFGLIEDQPGLVIGKMFGVLLVSNDEGEIGYLAAFSGKLASGNHHPKFVPPVFDILADGSWFREEEVEIDKITIRIKALEKSPEFIDARDTLKEQRITQGDEIRTQKEKMKVAKKKRKEIREAKKDIYGPEEFDQLLENLKQESLNAQFYMRDLTSHWKEKIQASEERLELISREINALKKERKARSGALQQWIFEQFQFLNPADERKSLLDIFEGTIHETPPAGAGECAAPKLLQYAFKNGLKPLSMAEFWWGQSPKSEVRKHQLFYPACRGKCEPILAHMLNGMEMDPNPLLENPAEGKDIGIIYEDEFIAIIDKPSEFLSVPGKNIHDSVFSRVKDMYPEATGPLVVHRLDMSTSGIMIIAKTKAAHDFLQRQFIDRKVKKRYEALLDGVIDQKKGMIDLPLRVDLNDRPRQLVCHEYGKPAQTRYVVQEVVNNKTRIHFYPVSGRTHQLRVHSAHPSGLNAAIIGDDLYGQKADRLHLHAQIIEFIHPKTREIVTFKSPTPF